MFLKPNQSSGISSHKMCILRFMSVRREVSRRKSHHSNIIFVRFIGPFRMGPLRWVGINSIKGFYSLIWFLSKFLIFLFPKAFQISPNLPSNVACQAINLICNQMFTLIRAPFMITSCNLFNDPRSPFPDSHLTSYKNQAFFILSLYTKRGDGARAKRVLNATVNNGWGLPWTMVWGRN